MKTKQQLIAELGCIQRRLNDVIGEISINHKDLVDDEGYSFPNNLHTAFSHISYVKRSMTNRMPR
jgi:hypothetical protein